jgi:hypothetical protein
MKPPALVDPRPAADDETRDTCVQFVHHYVAE